MPRALTLHPRTRRRRIRDAGPLPRAVTDDGGFSLVEAVVALAVLAVVVTTTAAWVLNSAQVTRLAHEDAQVADLLQDDLEKVRARPFATLTLASLPTTGSTSLTVDGSQEPLVAFAAPDALPRVVDATFNGTPYRLTRYVTRPASGCTRTDPTTSTTVDLCRRYSVMVTWQSGNRARTRWASELVSTANRSVAEDWSWTVPGGTPTISGTGGKVVVPLALLNNGNRNGWSLTATARYGSTAYGSARWYLDANADGVLQSAERAAPMDQAAFGTGQTGNVESGRLVRCLVEFTGLSAGRTYTVSARSTSLMEPSTATTPAVYQDVTAPVSTS